MNMVKKKINLKIMLENSIERHPVPLLGVDYRVKIVYKNSKMAQLDVEDNTIKISLPNHYKKSTDSNILDLAIDKMYEQIAKIEVERAMEKMRLMLGFAPEDYKFKKMEKQIAKCDGDEFVINPEIVRFHPRLIDYIVLHQYCHLKYKTHCISFEKMLKKYEPHYKLYEKQLKNVNF